MVTRGHSLIWRARPWGVKLTLDEQGDVFVELVRHEDLCNTLEAYAALADVPNTTVVLDFIRPYLPAWVTQTMPPWPKKLQP